MPYNVIFIDDSETIQKAVSTILIDNNDFKLNSIHDPSLISEAIANFKPDIIILNYSSVNIEINKNISEIKENRELSNIPLILLVPSDLSDSERESFIEAGVNGFIYRPFDKDGFISKIKRVMGISDTVQKTGESKDQLTSKIYDISLFEYKKSSENTAPPPVTETNNQGQTNQPVIESPEKSPNEDSALNIDSSELSQAFENLFKDDVIFKEFQELNKKGGETTLLNEPKLGNESLTEKHEIEEIVNPAPEQMQSPEEIQPSEQTQPYAETQWQMPETIQTDSTSVETAFDNTQSQPVSNQLSSTDFLMPKPADEEIINPTETPAETDAYYAKPNFTIGDILAQRTFEPNDIIISNEPDINNNSTAFGGNIFGEAAKELTKTGGLKLEILDEQNLIKLDEMFKNGIQAVLDEIKPQIIENLKNILPEIAEKLIKEELDKINKL